MGCRRRGKKKKQHSSKQTEDLYIIPDKGRLFPGRGRYAKKKIKRDHIGYHAVWAAVSKLAKGFVKEQPQAATNWKKLRTHSGRATRITLLMGEGVSLAMTMQYARHAKDSIRTHLKYGKLTCSHVHKYLAEERNRLLLQPGAHAIPALPARKHPPNQPDEDEQPAPPVPAPLRRMRKKQRVDEVGQLANPALPHALEDCSLKEAVTWFKSGLLSKPEFEKVKSSLLSSLPSSSAEGAS